MSDRILIAKGADGFWRWRRASAEDETITFGTGRFVTSEQATNEALRVNQEPFILQLTPVDATLVTDVSQALRAPVFAPFNADQIGSLNAFQGTTATNPFTCQRDRTHGRLVAQPDGWLCMVCEYQQSWAYAFMADWTWKGMIPADAAAHRVDEASGATH
jgi:hypothetical protein